MATADNLAGLLRSGTSRATGEHETFDVRLINHAMPEIPQTVYRLVRGDTLLGIVTHHARQDDFPWLGGVFEPTPEFDSVRPLFDDELRLLNADRMDEWGAVLEEIERPGLRLEPLHGGSPVTEFLIHIDGAETWWRC